MVFEIIFIGTGAYGAFNEFRSYTPGNGNAVFYGALCLGIAAMGLSLLRGNRVWYRFSGGSVSALTGRGKVLWQEDLAALKEVLYTRGRINSFITLVWADRRRRVELYASLFRELNGRDVNKFKWVISSLGHHVLFWELVFALPMFVIFLHVIYSEGTLTVAWAIWMAFGWSILGAAAAVIFWYAAVLPMTKGTRDRR